MQSAIELLDRIVRSVGGAVRYFVLVIILLIVFEICCRALFNISFTWTREIAQWLSAGIILLGGAQALVDNKFIRVDAVYGILPRRVQAIIDLTVGTVCFALVAYVLLRFGGKFATDSIARWETSTATWEGPVWIAKSLIPAGGFLMVLAWISVSLKNVQVLMGPPQNEPDPTEASD